MTHNIQICYMTLVNNSDLKYSNSNSFCHVISSIPPPPPLTTTKKIKH